MFGWRDGVATLDANCLVQLLAFWIQHCLLPRVIETSKVAGATCFAASSVCFGLVNAASFMP
jgi:uncharacterized membrane protein YjfL (UPF0719 family)